MKSKAQNKFMWAKHPDIARKWLKEYGKGYLKSLPEHVKRSALKRRKKRRK